MSHRCLMLFMANENYLRKAYKSKVGEINFLALMRYINWLHESFWFHGMNILMSVKHYQLLTTTFISLVIAICNGVRKWRDCQRLLTVRIKCMHAKSYELLAWTLMCLFKFPDWENLSKQSLHWYGFSPEWIRKCFVRVELSEKAFLHIRHR